MHVAFKERKRELSMPAMNPNVESFERSYLHVTFRKRLFFLRIVLIILHRPFQPSTYSEAMVYAEVPDDPTAYKRQEYW